MNVFISWSGKMSGELAKVLRDWLPSVIQAVKPYFSTDDIEKGTRGNTMLAKELEEASFGILCLTRENLDASWIMFEAGALSKSLDKSRGCPILFGKLSTTDLQGPLTNFQAAKFTKEEMRKVMSTMNTQLGDAALESKVLDKVFDKWWPELEQKVKDVLSQTLQVAEEKIRDDRELLEEILLLARQIPQLGRSHHTYRPLSEIFAQQDPYILNKVIKMLSVHKIEYVLRTLIEEGYDPTTAGELLRIAQLEIRRRATLPDDEKEETKSQVKKLRKTGQTKK